MSKIKDLLYEQEPELYADLLPRGAGDPDVYGYPGEPKAEESEQSNDEQQNDPF